MATPTDVFVFQLPPIDPSDPQFGSRFPPPEHIVRASRRGTSAAMWRALEHAPERARGFLERQLEQLRGG